MTRKKMLNVTSMKKRDTMLGTTNTNTSGVGQTTGQVQPAVITAAGTGLIMFCPTYRLAQLKSGPAGSMINQATRTSTTCFMRGFSESVRITTSSSIPWFHRRIVFTSKDVVFRVYAASDTPILSDNTGGTSLQETVRGYTRAVINQPVNNTPATRAARFEVLFKGAEGIDWNSSMTAPVDTRRVKVHHDKLTTIKSNNERGTVVKRKYWHGMNKNLVYNDDELADVTQTSGWSVSDSRGMGDMYIVDLFFSGIGGTASDVLAFETTASLYWHEK